MQNLLKDPRQHHVDEETLGPLDLDEVARVTAGTVHSVGTAGEWDPWRGAGGKPGEPAGSSEAALFKVSDERGDSIQGERPGPGLSHWWKGSTRLQSSGKPAPELQCILSAGGRGLYP